MNRRTFFKSLGAIAGVSAVAPSIALKRLEYPDFIPGRRYRNAVRTRQRDEKVFNRLKLIHWLEKKVPPNFINRFNVEFKDKEFDLGHEFGTGISYRSPLRPIR
jgi:hypothetical protein